MKSARNLTKGCLFLLILDISSLVAAGTHFRSHVSVNTPARSFTHGVGDPLPYGKRNLRPKSSYKSYHNSIPNRGHGGGYPRVRPHIPFTQEEVHAHNTGSYGAVLPWQYNSHNEIPIPVLPPSPYKVDSPDPESLWPEGLFVPPFHQTYQRRDGQVLSETDNIIDPYLLEGSDAVAAVTRATRHGLLYFHEIPHIESLLENQKLRIENNLKPHRIASIRHTWPYNRP